jgi:sec-independent protein translocase protein TatB
MFDIGWSEMAIIVVVALVVIGPKELPAALRTFAKWTKTARKLAREFQSGIDGLVREAELDEARKSIQSATQEVQREVEKAVDPTGEAKSLLKPNGGAPAPTPPAESVAAPAAPAAALVAAGPAAGADKPGD